jgi:hypothetical protein
MTYKITVTGAKEKFQDWIANRGGILVWPNVNLSDPGKGPMFTPARHDDGSDGSKDKPHWSVGDPTLVTSIDEFEFVTLREYKRFHVGVRRGDGLSIVLTDAAKRRLDRELAKASKDHGDAFYEFDYGDERNCVILVPAP